MGSLLIDRERPAGVERMSPSAWLVARSLNMSRLFLIATLTIARSVPATAAPGEERFLGDVKVPPEFEVSVFAAPPMVSYPVYVTAAPDGTLYVSSDKNGSIDRQPRRGSIVRLRDTDSDGRADERKVFVPDVDSPRGAVWDHDRLYLVHPPHLSAFIDHNGDGVSDEQKVLVKNIAFGFKDRPADHTTNGLTLAIDGWLYVAVGDFGFMEAEGTDGRKVQLRGGGVVRVRPDGTELQIYSTGTRNILDVAMSPTLDGFCRDNTNDGGGWDMRFHHFTGLEDHGYPRLYMNFPDEHIKPLAEYGGGSGCGGCYLNEPGFPERYASVPLTCDWGRNFIYSHHLTPNGATFKDDCREFIGLTRVTDCDVDAMSRLYAASWRGATFTYAGEDVGYIVQVRPKGYTPEPLPDFEKMSGVELVRLLESPSARRRMEAQRTLIRSGIGQDAMRELYRVCAEYKSPAAGVAALFAVKQAFGPKALSFLGRHMASQFVDSLRPFAFRAMCDREHELAGAFDGDLVTGLHEPNTRTRLESLVCAARLGSSKLARHVAASLGHPDAVIAHTAFHVLAKLRAADACFTVVDKSGAPDPQRQGALFALMRMHEPEVGSGLIERLDRETDGSRRRGLLAALCRLHFREGTWQGDSWGTRPDTRGPYYQPEKWSESDKIMAALKSAMTEAHGEEAAWLAAEMTRNRIEDDSAFIQILKLAATDAKMMSAALAQLARKDTLPAEALPVLLKAAAAPDIEQKQRVIVIASLVKTDSAEAWTAALNALVAMPARRRGGGDNDRVAQAFLSAPKLENFHTMFEQEAAKSSGPVSQWADAALLALSARSTGSPEAREQSAKALEAGWADPKRRAQILTAVAAIRHRAWSPRVLAALKDPDTSVAEAARRTARVLRLDPADADAPKIESMKPEEVIAAVLTTKGDPEIGAQIYQQATCVNCHTVSKDAPPRGPFLGNIANTYKRPELAEAILNPNKTIAQGFVTSFFTLKKGDPVMGFIISESATEVTIRNQAGIEQKIPASEMAGREQLPHSLMPPGLMNQMTVKDFASLLDYLESLAKQQTK
jgi:putative membrane-bound dehydrogenase-like protein